MSFTAKKATDLKTSYDSLDSLKATINTSITEFEEMLNSNAATQEFNYVLETGSPDVDEYCKYKEISWCYFGGPLPGGMSAGWHFVFKTFKSKVVDYGDESTYIGLVKEKVSLMSSVEDKQLAESSFDSFLDAFKADIDSKLS